MIQNLYIEVLKNYYLNYLILCEFSLPLKWDTSQCV